GRGTTFNIFLPRVDEEPISESTQKASPTVATSKQTILVVEDEESLLKSTCSLLRAVGYEVLEALGGSEALRISQVRNRDIQVVLTDVVMPGMDGVELVQHLIAQRPSLKVIYMSGYTGQSAGRSAAFSPDALFLMKPFTREELVRKIQDALQAQTVGATA
ncbi:MAG: response regulator, partial [Terriglobales bacterium]